MFIPCAPFYVTGRARGVGTFESLSISSAKSDLPWVWRPSIELSDDVFLDVSLEVTGIYGDTTRFSGVDRKFGRSFVVGDFLLPRVNRFSRWNCDLPFRSKFVV